MASLCIGVKIDLSWHVSVHKDLTISISNVDLKFRISANMLLKEFSITRMPQAVCTTISSFIFLGTNFRI